MTLAVLEAKVWALHALADSGRALARVQAEGRVDLFRRHQPEPAALSRCTQLIAGLTRGASGSAAGVSERELRIFGAIACFLSWSLLFDF